MTTIHHLNIQEKARPPISNFQFPTCYHCGEDCPPEVISFEDKDFCCEGCRTVFEILSANELTGYYHIEASPGMSLKGQSQDRYAWLDDPGIAAQLIDFQDEKVVKVTFLLPQIHCASCVWLLENLYKLNEGVLRSTVNFLKKEVYITIDKQALSLRQIVQLLALIGYAPTINLGSLGEKEKSRPVDRTFFYQLGIAGFAFGNIMLLSFPEYLGLADLAFQKWFGYLNILLALPVVFFCARDYLRSAFYGLRNGHLNIDVPITLGILTLFGRSLFEIFTHSGAGYLDSLAGLVFFLLIGKWFQQKTYHRLSFERDYRSYFPIAATLLRSGKKESVALDRLVIGDTVLVLNGELIPADGILLKGRARIDYSFVTGESAPVSKTVGEKIFAGGRIAGDPIELTLTKKVSQSYLTQLWNDAVFDKEESSNASRLADKVGKRFTWVILVIAFATLFYWLSVDVPLAINAFTAVLIIACPCAVALSIPFTLGNAIRLFGRRNFYLKNTQVIENLAEVDTIVFDKTGTITETEQGELTFIGQLTDAEKAAVQSLASQSNHPVSRQVARLFEGAGALPVSNFVVIPGMGTQGMVGFLFVEIKKEKEGTAIRIDGDRLGVFLQHNTYRAGFERFISGWKERFSLYVLSGDNDREKDHLSNLLPSANLYFDQSPQDKLAFIKKLQSEGRKVLMFGDGLNDAGALRQSDAGIVITENTNNFTPASDGILDAAEFKYLPAIMKYAKGSIHLVYASYVLAFIYNVVGLSFAVQGLLSPVIAAILMPLSSITIVAFGVGASTLLAGRQFNFH